MWRKGGGVEEKTSQHNRSQTKQKENPLIWVEDLPIVEQTHLLWKETYQAGEKTSLVKEKLLKEEEPPRGEQAALTLVFP